MTRPVVLEGTHREQCILTERSVEQPCQEALGFPNNAPDTLSSVERILRYYYCFRSCYIESYIKGMFS